MENANKNQYVFVQLGPEPIGFDKLLERIEGITLLDILDDKTALVELVGIEPQDVLDKFSNILLEPNLADYTRAKKKSKSPFSEEDYETMRVDTEKRLIDLGLPAEFSKNRARWEIDSLRDVFNKMPEIV